MKDFDSDRIAGLAPSAARKSVILSSWSDSFYHHTILSPKLRFHYCWFRFITFPVVTLGYWVPRVDAMWTAFKSSVEAAVNIGSLLLINEENLSSIRSRLLSCNRAHSISKNRDLLLGTAPFTQFQPKGSFYGRAELSFWIINLCG
jgi:hypothetical protein